jgi:tetratricopeptide (TPR) repeat protein
MYAEKSIAILEAMPGRPSTSLAHAYTKAGVIYGRLEQRAELREWTQKGVDLFIELEGPSYRGLASAYSGLAFSYALEGDYEPALKYFRLEHEISRANFGEQHLRSAVGLINMGIAFRRMDRLEEAADSLLRAEAILIDVSGDDSRRLSGLYNNLGSVYQDMGSLEEAAATFTKGLSLVDAEESNPRDSAYLLNNMGDLSTLMGRTDEAEKRLRRALDTKIRVFGADNISTARTLLLLVSVQIQTGIFTDAEELLLNAEEIYEATYGSDHTKMSFFELIKGKYAREKGDLIPAQQLITSAYTRRLEEYDESHPDVLIVALEMARTEFALGNIREARRWLDKGIVGYTESADSSLEVIEIDLINAELLAAEGDIDEAMKIERELTQTIATHFPARSDWLSRISALQLNQ